MKREDMTAAAKFRATCETCCEGNAIRESVHTLACLMRPRYAARARAQGEPDPRPTAETEESDR